MISMKKPMAFLSLGISLLTVACTNQQAYQAVQNNRLHECQKMPPSAAEKCTEQHGQTFEDYQRHRQETLNSHE